MWICLLLLGGCSREQQDWRAAEAADTIQAYDRFIQRHPDSELVSQAHIRAAQLGEDRDWQHAGSADTVDAYREFLQQHPNGKWSQEARIRIENFALSEQAGTDAGSRSVAAPAERDRASGGGTAAVPAAGEMRGAQGRESPEAPGARGGETGAGTLAKATQGGEGPSVAAGVGGSSAMPATPSGTLAVPGEAAVAAGSGGAARSGAGASGPGGPAGSAAPGRSGPPALRPAAQAGASVAGSASDTRGLPSPPAGGFGIQLGAFSSEAGASSQWRVLLARFGPELQGLQQRIVPADTPTGRIYRLQAPVGSEARARGICEVLRKQSQGCVAVLPH